jgi:glycosyltransferase involved in cell wall biosynthesis
MTNKQLKVIHILDNLGTGGKEKNVIDICNKLDARKFKVIILCLYSNEQKEYVPLKNIEVYRINLKQCDSVFLQIISNFIHLPKILKVLKRHNPEIVHTHTFFYSILPVLMSILFLKKTKHFHTIHTGGMHYLNLTNNHAIKLKVEKFFYFLLKTRLIAISRILELRISNLFPRSKVNLVQNGISIDEKRKSLMSNEAKTCFAGVYVARMVDGKNHITILKALAELKKTDMPFKFTFIGSGPLINELITITEKLSLSDNIEFTGDLSDVRTKLKEFHFGIFSSEYEGFSLALIEMMAEGFPVLVSNAPTILDMGVNENNSILFNTLDYIDLKNKILDLFYDQGKQKLFGESARCFAEQFTIHNMIDQLEQSYLS